MTTKRKPGAPKKSELKKKRSMTCSVSQATSKAAIRLYGSRGKAIEAAVKYHSIIDKFMSLNDEITNNN